jgi:hypothetical protein
LADNEISLWGKRSIATLRMTASGAGGRLGVRAHRTSQDERLAIGKEWCTCDGFLGCQ